MAHGGIYRWNEYRENPDTIHVLLEYGEPDKSFLVNYATSLINGFGWSLNVLGTHGTLQAEHDWRVSGEGSKRRDALKETHEIGEAPDTLHHMANWLDCVRRRDTKGLYAGVEAGHGHSVACIMSTQAFWNGARAVFDATKREIHVDIA